MGYFDCSSGESLCLQRWTSVHGAAEGRLESTSLLFKQVMYRRPGIGLDAGTSAQGAQQVGGAVKERGGAGEAGIRVC
jgi:hypothetical protein